MLVFVKLSIDRKVEMVSFELGEKLRKMFFCLVTSVGQRKILSPHEESNLRPSDLEHRSATTRELETMNVKDWCVL